LIFSLFWKQLSVFVLVKRKKFSSFSYLFFSSFTFAINNTFVSVRNQWEQFCGATSCWTKTGHSSVDSCPWWAVA